MQTLNPAAMMAEISRSSSNLGVKKTSTSSSVGGRVVPSRAALAKVRRDLFGPVDHEAARALAKSELQAQSILDSERWGFDFRLGVPKSGSRYKWELVTPSDFVPESYALRGMPYLRQNSPLTTLKRSSRIHLVDANARTTSFPAPVVVDKLAPPSDERTPPKETRVPSITGSDDVEPCTEEEQTDGVIEPPRAPCKIGFSPMSPTTPERSTLQKQASILGE